MAYTIVVEWTINKKWLGHSSCCIWGDFISLSLLLYRFSLFFVCVQSMYISLRFIMNNVVSGTKYVTRAYTTCHCSFECAMRCCNAVPFFMYSDVTVAFCLFHGLVSCTTFLYLSSCLFFFLCSLFTVFRLPSWIIVHNVCVMVLCVYVCVDLTP